MNKDFLPIGTVIVLKGSNAKLMITGFCQMDVETKRKTDYCGCLYPEGYIESGKHFLFNEDDIANVLFIGYKDEDEVKFKEQIIEILKEEEIEQVEL